MSSPIPLTPTSWIVLGLVERAGDAVTPYDLKQGVAATVGNFWSVPHSQLYRECDRLADAGLLDAEQEPDGRRRKRFRLTDAGAQALDGWRASPPTGELPELRNLALLQLFFGADPAALAREQLEAHRRKLAHYEALQAIDTGTDPRGPWLALEAGIAHERLWVAFWERLAAV
jgi:PadR family transcriptional regulator, regulatory protein AphA